VENASYGLTICAERVAIFKAIAAGEQEITALAVVSGPGAVPCGACRQVLAEFTPNADRVNIFVVNGQGDERSFTLGQLLPAIFSGQELGLRMTSPECAHRAEEKA
jgi:cytidine deaminase